MWELEKAVLITNNDRVYEKYKDQLQVILLKTYEEVLIKARDMVRQTPAADTSAGIQSEAKSDAVSFCCRISEGRGRQHERYHADREVH